jgi:flagellar basal-body rod protein FlgC
MKCIYEAIKAGAISFSGRLLRPEKRTRSARRNFRYHEPEPQNLCCTIRPDARQPVLPAPAGSAAARYAFPRNMPRSIKLLAVALCALMFASCGKSVSIMTYNQAQKARIKNVLVYNKHDVEVLERGNFLTIKKVSKEVLTDILQTEYLNIQLLLSNINNANTTKLRDGFEYRKQKLFVSDLTGIQIIQDSDSSGRLIYDPTHPEAARTGRLAGFVKFPNINVKEEYIELIDSMQLFNAVAAYAREHDANIIISELFQSEK